MRLNQHPRAFTLIELLVSVAIIAILAAIAVPNFLEAQTRAKVSRVKADLRTLATAIEAYYVDYNRYVWNDGVFNVVPKELSTPLAYLTSTKLIDPFSDKENDPVHGELARYYTYMLIVHYSEVNAYLASGHGAPVEAVDAPGFNPGAFRRYGGWRLASNGPDRKYQILGAPADPFNPNPAVLQGADVPYDPTNGTVSKGNLLRTGLFGDRAGI